MGARGAGNSACQFSKMGFCLSKLPSNQNSGFLPTKLGVKWVSTAKCQIFLFRLGILSKKITTTYLALKRIIFLLERYILPYQSFKNRCFKVNRFRAQVSLSRFGIKCWSELIAAPNSKANKKILITKLNQDIELPPNCWRLFVKILSSFIISLDSLLLSLSNWNMILCCNAGRDTIKCGNL